MDRVLKVRGIGDVRLGVRVRGLRSFDLALQRFLLPIGVVGFFLGEEKKAHC